MAAEPRRRVADVAEPRRRVAAAIEPCRRVVYGWPVFWPLIGAFIAFVLFGILMGWIMDAPKRQDGRRR